MFVVCLYIYCIKSAFEPDEASVYSTWYTYHLLSILASDQSLYCCADLITPRAHARSG